MASGPKKSDYQAGENEKALAHVAMQQRAEVDQLEKLAGARFRHDSQKDRSSQLRGRVAADLARTERSLLAKGRGDVAATTKGLSLLDEGRAKAMRGATSQGAAARDARTLNAVNLGKSRAATAVTGMRNLARTETQNVIADIERKASRDDATAGLISNAMRAAGMAYGAYEAKKQHIERNKYELGESVPETQKNPASLYARRSWMKGG